MIDLVHLIDCTLVSDPRAIAKIINSQWSRLLSNSNSYQLRHLDAIGKCRTAALGGHLYVCDQCGHRHKRYNSCRNRHCSQCQHTQKAAWIQARIDQLLPTRYFHVVFTLPHSLNELCMTYPRQLYKMLFSCSWATLDTFGWDYKHLGAQLGATMVLHTWGSNLSYHPHVHCIVPGGGVAVNDKWRQVKAKGKYLFPVRALSKVFRGKFIEQLKLFCAEQGLDNIDVLIKELYAKDWVVYTKPPFGGAQGVIKYLARYTHNTAISHHRIKSYDAKTVQFGYKDYRHGNQSKVMTLESYEFVRRFTMHLLPKGFTRIRHYGILSSQWKSRIFPDQGTTISIDWKTIWESKGLHVDQCPNCRKGQLSYARQIPPSRGPPYTSFSNPHRAITQ